MPQKRANTPSSSQKMNSPQQKKSEVQNPAEKQIPPVKRTPDGTVEENSEEQAP